MRRVLEEVSGALLVLMGTFLFLLVTWMGLKFLGGLFPGHDEPASKREQAHARVTEAGQRDVQLVEQPAIRGSGAQNGERRALPER